jgi:hypothetical protein
VTSPPPAFPTERPSTSTPTPRPRSPGPLPIAVALAALFPVGLAAQALHPATGLAWTQLFVFLLPALAIAARAGLDPLRFVRLSRPPPRTLGLALLAGAAGFLAGGALMALWAALLPEELVEAFDLADLFGGPPLERAVMIGGAALLAPLCEEVAFRGHLLSALRLRHRPGTAVALSAAFFAVLHLDPVRLPALLLLGLLYGWLAWRAGSIWPAVLAHAVNNSAAVVLGLPGGAGAPDEPPPAPLASAAVLLAALVVLLPILRGYRRATAPQPPEEALSPGAGRPRWPGVAAVAGLVSLAALALLARR